MTKEEQINEMAQVLGKCCLWQQTGKLNCYDCKYYSRENGVCCSYGHKEAETMYAEGYRKADEVRKETAQKVIKPYQHERFGKNGQTYSLKCGRCNKTVQTKWNYCPFCGAKLREVEE